MELNCRVRNSQESIKDILKRQILNLRRYDPDIATWNSWGHPDCEQISIPWMEKCQNGDYLSFDDVINLFK